jgi:zinc transport system substrate-binding protein
MNQKRKNVWQCLLVWLLFGPMLISGAGAAVLASVRPLGFIVSAIADGVTPTEILLPDEMSYKYTLHTDDVKRIRRADLVVWIGPEFEGFMAQSVAQLPPNRQIAVVQLPGVAPWLASDDDKSDNDPHHANMYLWLSPEIARQAALAIHQKLVELMPQKKSQLDANLHQFEVGLTKTDKNVGKMLQPVRSKGYFVFHDIYGYFERHFGLSPLEHFTSDTKDQPDLQRLQFIRQQWVEKKTLCVIADPKFRPAFINTVTQRTKVHVNSLNLWGKGINVSKDSYMSFLNHLSAQYISCLE